MQFWGLGSKKKQKPDLLFTVFWHELGDQENSHDCVKHEVYIRHSEETSWDGVYSSQTGDCRAEDTTMSIFMSNIQTVDSWPKENLSSKKF